MADNSNVTLPSAADSRPAPPWLTVRRGAAPLVLSIPHSGLEIPQQIEQTLRSGWLARCDTDWYVERLYDFATDLDATIVRTGLSRTVIDVNRDPSGRSLYPGQATTELCPTMSFDGDPLYQPGTQPSPEQIAARTGAYFRPYHDALAAELTRLTSLYGQVVLYDCHSIRSRIPRLFAGDLPHLNLGTNSGASCAAKLREQIVRVCAESAFTHVVDGRFKGGYITRHYGRPTEGVHALQMELACRAYLHERPGAVHPHDWPPPYDAEHAQPLRGVLRRILEACLALV